MTRYAYDRVRTGQPMPGVFEVSQNIDRRCHRFCPPAALIFFGLQEKIRQAWAPLAASKHNWCAVSKLKGHPDLAESCRRVDSKIAVQAGTRICYPTSPK